MSFSAQLDLSFLIPTSKRGNTGEKVDKVNQNVFANDGAKADTLRNAYKKLTNRPAALPVLLQKTIRKQKSQTTRITKKKGMMMAIPMQK